jgi:hypothetical protein
VQHAQLLSARPDFFGGFAVAKEWGRIGARGRMVGEWHLTEAQALAAVTAGDHC